MTAEPAVVDVWDDPAGTWIDCEDAAALVDSICGEGTGWTALLHRLEADKIGVQAREWGIVLADHGPDHPEYRGWRRRVIRGLHTLTGLSSEGAAGIEVEYASRAAGDFSGRVWVDRSERTYVPWFIHGLQFRREDIIASFGQIPRGRPKGSGSMEARDIPHLQAMEKLIATGAAKSVRDAAGQAASGTGEPFQTAFERLRKRYPRWAKVRRI